jgi:hypothetical protein
MFRQDGQGVLIRWKLCDTSKRDDTAARPSLSPKNCDIGPDKGTAQNFSGPVDRDGQRFMTLALLADKHVKRRPSKWNQRNAKSRCRQLSDIKALHREFKISGLAVTSQ